MKADEWYNIGLDLEELGSTEEALYMYEQAIAADTANSMGDAHVNIGRIQQIQGNIDEAKQRYEIALLLNPDHHLAAYNLGTVYDEKDDYVHAIEMYKKAVTVADSYYNLSRICEMQGDEFSAVRYMRIYKRMAND